MSTNSCPTLVILSDTDCHGRDVAIWSVAEPSLGIIAGCMATLRPLVKGFGFGQDTTERSTRFTNRNYATPRRTAPDSERRAPLLLQKLGDYNPSSPGWNVDLTDQTPRTVWDSTQRTTGQDVHAGIEPSAPPRTLIRTDIVGSKDPWAERDSRESLSGLQGITVHTSILTESTYETKERKGAGSL